MVWLKVCCIYNVERRQFRLNPNQFVSTINMVNAFARAVVGWFRYCTLVEVLWTWLLFVPGASGPLRFKYNQWIEQGAWMVRRHDVRSGNGSESWQGLPPSCITNALAASVQCLRRAKRWVTRMWKSFSLRKNRARFHAMVSQGSAWEGNGERTVRFLRCPAAVKPLLDKAKVSQNARQNTNRRGSTCLLLMYEIFRAKPKFLAHFYQDFISAWALLSNSYSLKIYCPLIRSKK